MVSVTLTDFSGNEAIDAWPPLYCRTGNNDLHGSPRSGYLWRSLQPAPTDKIF